MIHDLQIAVLVTHNRVLEELLLFLGKLSPVRVRKRILDIQLAWNYNILRT